jgi:hypothetical protein
LAHAHATNSDRQPPEGDLGGSERVLVIRVAGSGQGGSPAGPCSLLLVGTWSLPRPIPVTRWPAAAGRP